MSIKKRLGLGAMSAVMGLSLIGTGTWAAFNDIESVQAKVGAGELNLDLKQLGNGPIDFKISNLKPGDHMTRTIKLDNIGSLAIKDVLMSIEGVEFENYAPDTVEDAGYGDTDTWGDNTAIEYLQQFKVSVIKVGAEGGAGGFPLDIIPSTANVTLADFYLASDSVAGDQHKIDNGATNAMISAAKTLVYNSINQVYIDDNSDRLNVSTINPDKWTGLPVIPGDDDNLQIKIEFVESNDDTNSDGTHDQNIFQGDSADITFQFEARQWGGLNVKDSDMKNGVVETNKKANSQTN
ncbi:TasA family protein [Rossellomorea oryzaecorticis]|uniref:TasA family protein n=1 Tax=Rossellomorea oryzaecorticis TaxID=1396505 RepID=A0ABU9K4K6_9BACI